MGTHHAELWSLEDESAFQAVRSTTQTLRYYVKGEQEFTMVPRVVMNLALETSKVLEAILEEIRDASPPF